MRLEKIQDLLREKHISFDYTEEEGCGSIDFEYRGLSYHIWEYADGDGPCGVETNVANVGRTRELEGNSPAVLEPEESYSRGKIRRQIQIHRTVSRGIPRTKRRCRVLWRNRYMETRQPAPPPRRAVRNSVFSEMRKA